MGLAGNVHLFHPKLISSILIEWVVIIIIMP